MVGVGQTARTLKWRMPRNLWGGGGGYAAVCTYTDATTQSRKDSQFRLNGGGRRLSGEKKRERVGTTGGGRAPQFNENGRTHHIWRATATLSASTQNGSPSFQIANLPQIK